MNNVHIKTTYNQLDKSIFKFLSYNVKPARVLLPIKWRYHIVHIMLHFSVRIIISQICLPTDGVNHSSFLALVVRRLTSPRMRVKKSAMFMRERFLYLFILHHAKKSWVISFLQDWHDNIELLIDSVGVLTDNPGLWAFIFKSIASDHRLSEENPRLSIDRLQIMDSREIAMIISDHKLIIQVY